MKFADDALFGIMASLRKGLSEGIDISSMLRKMELVVLPDGRLGLDPSVDPWKDFEIEVTDVWKS